MEKLLHKDVELKSGLKGRIVGFLQDKPEVPMQYYIEYWKDGDKSGNWYYVEDFKTI